MTPVGTEPELADRILGGWLCRIAGNMLGKPVEQGDLWTRDRIDRYLRQAAALPLTDYLPEPVGESDGFELRPEWRECVRGRIHGSCRDDDVDYAILGLDLLETHGFGFSTEQVGDLWLLRLPYLQTFTAERAAYRNLANGLKPPLTATYDNPCQEWIGALIRADIYGWTCPGAPRRAAALARRDAVLSHTGNGVQLVVSELVTNARKCAPGPCLLDLEISKGAVQISVWDSDTTLPSVQGADPDRIGQHGLEIVMAVSQTFCVHRAPVGKKITLVSPWQRKPAQRLVGGRRPLSRRPPARETGVLYVSVSRIPLGPKENVPGQNSAAMPVGVTLVQRRRACVGWIRAARRAG
ncbi:ADP-ribosylglycohydrolase family protein [Streptomyces canus]|uniref:ADP-ribosylglycohydrolase family protein n=1 Tax=Streptomyces canus TaxID=58343 RepID=UPI002E268FDE